MCIFKL